MPKCCKYQRFFLSASTMQFLSMECFDQFISWFKSSIHYNMNILWCDIHLAQCESLPCNVWRMWLCDGCKWGCKWWHHQAATATATATATTLLIPLILPLNPHIMGGAPLAEGNKQTPHPLVLDHFNSEWQVSSLVSSVSRSDWINDDFLALTWFLVWKFDIRKCLKKKLQKLAHDG